MTVVATGVLKGKVSAEGMMVVAEAAVAIPAAIVAAVPAVAIAPVVVPRVIPAVAVAIPRLIPRVVQAIVHAPMVPAMAPAPAVRAEAPVPIMPVIRGGEDVGIEPVVVDVPVPHGPETAAIDDVPVERAADGDGIAGVAEADDTHGHLVVLGVAVEAIHPAVVLLVDDERVHAIVERVAVGRTDAQGHVADLGLLHVVALVIDVAAHVAATVIRVVVYRQRGIHGDGSPFVAVLFTDADGRHADGLAPIVNVTCTVVGLNGCRLVNLGGSSLLLRDEVEVIVRLCGHRAQHDRHQKTKE